MYNMRRVALRLRVIGEKHGRRRGMREMFTLNDVGGEG